jgi:hypothetical protein
LITSIRCPYSTVARIANLYNRDLIASAIERTKQLYQKELDLVAIECAENEGMSVHQSETPSKENTGKPLHVIA